MSMIYGGSNVTFPDGTTQNTAPSGMGFKNRLINGSMLIDQRNAGAAVTYNGVEAVYNLDRWQAGAIGGGAFTVQQSSVAPAGFTTSQKYTVTTADTSLAASDRYSMYQYIEGYNVADLGFGTSNATTFTISFWIQSSVTGSYGVAVYNAGFDRAIVNTVTINSANTWEYKTVTFTADTSGTWYTTNGVGLRMAVVFAMGSSFQGTANTWTNGFIGTTSSQVNWMGTNGNTLYITGVQLEKGSTATSFDYRPYGTELALCQRYYLKLGPANNFITYDSYNTTGASCNVQFTFPVAMRSTPTGSISAIGDFGFSNTNSGNFAATGLSATTGRLGTDASGTARCQWYTNNANAFAAYSIEL